MCVYIYIYICTQIYYIMLYYIMEYGMTEERLGGRAGIVFPWARREAVCKAFYQAVNEASINSINNPIIDNTNDTPTIITIITIIIIITSRSSSNSSSSSSSSTTTTTTTTKSNDTNHHNIHLRRCFCKTPIFASRSFERGLWRAWSSK